MCCDRLAFFIPYREDTKATSLADIPNTITYGTNLRLVADKDLSTLFIELFDLVCRKTKFLEDFRARLIANLTVATEHPEKLLSDHAFEALSCELRISNCTNILLDRGDCTVCFD